MNAPLQLCTIRFAGEESDEVRVHYGLEFAAVLTPVNSPVLFGCRTGICGTCLVEVHAGDFPSPSEDEKELLELFAPGRPRARLACQLSARGNCTLEVMESP